MPTILYTSLTEIQYFNPCPSGWRDILKGQEKTKADDILFPLIDCLKSNSINDVCWLLGKRKAEVEICVKFAQKCVDSVKHLNDAVDAAYAADAAAAAADAAAYAAADTAADTAAYDAASAATYAAYAAAYAATYAAYAAAYQSQKELNKQFLIQCIEEYQESH